MEFASFAALISYRKSATVAMKYQDCECWNNKYIKKYNVYA